MAGAGAGNRNLARLAEEVAERRGDYPALVFEGRTYSSAELHERATRLALDVAPGDRVVVMLENSPDVPALYHAAWRAGAVVTPVIFLLTSEELRRILVDCEPALVVTSDTFRSTVDAAAAGLGLRVAVAGDLDETEPAPIVPRTDDDLAALVYTGGTTGRSKGVMLTHANLWEAGRRGHEAGNVPGIVRALICLPLAHAFGLLVLAIGLQSDERPQSVLMRWFDPDEWLRLAQEHRSQVAPVVPSMLHLLLARPLEEYDLSELRYIGSGAAPLPRETIAELGRRLPHVELREGYGLTESAGLVATNLPGRVRHGTVGLPVPGCEVRLADDGEICVRSPTVMKGYWRSPELTAETLRDGWLHTGDIGRIDADGYLTIVDRKKDLIIRGGFNVFPRDVEEALLEHPAITGACALGRPDETLGEEVVAFVTVAMSRRLDGGSQRAEAAASPAPERAVEPSEEELFAFGKERLGGYKYPREIHIVSSLPLTPVGKVDRKALRELVPTRGGIR